MTRAHVPGVAWVLAAVLGAANPAGQARPVQAPRSFTSTATAILVDVVVRDKHGRQVTDLSASDFHVAEDGVRQRVETFTRVSHGGGIGVGIAWRSPVKRGVVPSDLAPAADAAGTPMEDATTALVFDHLSPDTLRLAQKATLDYVPLSGESGVRVGVFATEPAMRVVQGYTTDRARVRQAVARVQPSGVSLEEQKADRADELTTRRRQLLGQTDAATGTASGATPALAQNASQLGERETELSMVQTELNMLRSFENFDRSTRGYDTSQSLMAVVRSLAEYPGRKTIVFFSEGLPVSPALTARLDAVIDAANRANVTAYAVDAKGLRARSSLENPRKELTSFSEDRLLQVTAGRDRTDQPLSMAMERVEDTIKIDSRAGLARLAADTGGLLIEQTNNLSSALRRIDEDNEFHYLLTYTPTNDLFDGTFRAIRVTVARPGTQVFARKGYRALRARPSADAVSYETDALALVDRAPLPNAFPIRAAGFSFPDPARPGLSPVLVNVSTASLRFDVDRQRSTYSARAAVVVRLRDAQGRDVQTLGQQYALTGDAKDLEAARRGNILFYREPDLAAGVYTVESVVFDETARQGSVRLSTLTVPPVADGLGMSSLVLVERAEDMGNPQAAAAGPSGPLYVGHTLLYPNLGESIRKSATGDVAFYFVLYGEPQGVTATAELLRNGEPVATAPIELPRAAAGDRAQHVGRLPIGQLPNGTYELRIRVSGTGRELSRTAYFTLED